MLGWQVEKICVNGGKTVKELEVRDLDASEYKLWDELVENSPHGTIFHTSDWLNICKESFGHDLRIFGCFDDDDLVGGCSLFIKEYKGIFNVASSTCNLTPYGGLLLKKSLSTKVREQESFQNNVLKTILTYIKNNQFDRVSIIPSPDFIDIRQFTYSNWITEVKYAYYLDLNNNIESTISKNARNLIRKATQNNVKIKKDNNPLLFYDLFKSTFEKQNMIPPAQINFFENILDFLTSKYKGEMWVAETSVGEPASAEIVVWDNKRAYRWVAASNANLKHLGSTSLLLYNIFQNLKNQRFSEINLMAANTPQLTKFISSFNPKLVPYYPESTNNVKYNIFKNIRGRL